MFWLGPLKGGLSSKRSRGVVEKCNRLDTPDSVSQDHKTWGREGYVCHLLQM